MAENITGTSSSNWGGILVNNLPFSSNSNFSGFLPIKVFISIGSLKGSIEGFVTWLAFIKSLSQYMGYGLSFPIPVRRIPPVSACLYISFIALVVH